MSQSGTHNSPVAPIDRAWWQSFGDPAMTALIDKALADNTDIAVAMARVREMEANLALAVGRIQQRGHSASESDGVIGGTEFPGVSQEYCYQLSRLEPGRDEAMRQGFDQVTIFGIGETPTAGGVDNGDLFRKAPAGIEDDAVNEPVCRVSVEAGAQHGGSDCSENRIVMM